MGRTGRRAKRDDAPVALVVLSDEVRDPACGRESRKIALQALGIERKRQQNAVW
jgi:hypothetical protein